MSEKKFKHIDHSRGLDLRRLLWHTITTYGLSAMLEQLIDLINGTEPYEQRLTADLKKMLATYEARYKLDPEDKHGEN
jgi:hypothetical protein